MRSKLFPMLILPAAIGAAVVAPFIIDCHASSDATPAPSAAPAEPVPGPIPSGMTTLPANHPPLNAAPGASGQSPHASGMLPNAENDQAAAIAWNVPKTWQTAPNPNPMRLATYKISEGLEAAVSRAGGTTDANVQRWSDMFEGAKTDRKERQINGVKVTTVRITGAYASAGMGGGPTEKHDNWGMLAAIAESSGAAYFFKIVGPTKDLDSAKPAFDSLIDSIKPTAAAGAAPAAAPAMPAGHPVAPADHK